MSSSRMSGRLDFSFSKYSKLEYKPQNWSSFKPKSAPPSGRNVIRIKEVRKSVYERSRKFDKVSEETDDDDAVTEIDEGEFEQSPFVHPVTPLPEDPATQQTHQNFGVMNSYRRMLIHRKPISILNKPFGFPELASRSKYYERFRIRSQQNRLKKITDRAKRKYIRSCQDVFSENRKELNSKAASIMKHDPQIEMRNKEIGKIFEKHDKKDKDHLDSWNTFEESIIMIIKSVNQGLTKADKLQKSAEAKAQKKMDKLKAEIDKEEEEMKKKFEEENAKREEAKKMKGGQKAGPKQKPSEDGSQPQQPQPSQAKKNPHLGLKREWLKQRDSLTRPPKNCSANAYTHYIRCIRCIYIALSLYTSIDAKRDPAFKSLRRDIRKIINQTGTDLKEVNNKYEEIRSKLENAKRGHAGLYYFGIVTLAEVLVEKGAMEISRDKTKQFAFSFGYLALKISTKFKHFRNIFLGKIYLACPWAIPWSPVKPASMDERTYKLERLKFSKKRTNPDGLETVDMYFTRMEGVVCLYSAYMVIPRTPHPHMMSCAWFYFSNLLNIKDINKFTPSIIIGFLTIAGYAMFKTYKGQFIKLLKIIEKDILPKFETTEGVNKSSVGRIKLYIEEIRKNKKPAEIKYCEERFWETV